MAAFAAMTLMQSCFTGVESTPRISERDLRRVQHAERHEESFLADILPEPPAQWRQGKAWKVIDPRSERLFGADLSNAVITYAGVDEATSITGHPEAILRFDSPAGRVSYRTDISADSLSRRASFTIPYTVEQVTVDSVRSRLKGRDVFVITSVWNDLAGQSLRGIKNISVKIEDVAAGDGIYPLRLLLSYEPSDKFLVNPGTTLKDKGERRYFTLPMSSPGADIGSSMRTFADIFSFTDPRLRYPKIEDAAWANIQAGRVVPGMTRDECRLSIGSPAEISRNPGYNALYESWTYPDGIRLIFVDGILSRTLR